MTPLRFLLVAAVFVLSGCVTSAKKLSLVSLGMTKAQVVEILGEPASVSARPDGELLRYQLSGRYAPPLNPNAKQFADGYTIQLVDGKVVAYGRDDEFRAVNVNVRRVE